MLKIAVKNYSNYDLIDFNDILYCKADGRYTWIYLKNGERIISARVLKNYESLLAQKNFVRIHRSCMVNIRHVSNYEKGKESSITMDNGVKFSIAKRRKKAIWQHLSKMYAAV